MSAGTLKNWTVLNTAIVAHVQKHILWKQWLWLPVDCYQFTERSANAHQLVQWLSQCDSHATKMSTKMPELNCAHEPLSESFCSFKAWMTPYLEDNDVTDNVKKATKIKIAIGNKGICRVLACGLTEAEQKNPQKIWDLLETKLDASTHIIYRVHRLELASMKQKPNESITEYVSRLRQKASKCEFLKCDHGDDLSEQLIEMVIMSMPFEDFWKEVLSKPKGHPITEILERGHQYEALLASETSLKTIHQGASRTQVDAIKAGKRPCGNCGTHHLPSSVLPTSQPVNCVAQRATGNNSVENQEQTFQGKDPTCNRGSGHPPGSGKATKTWQDWRRPKMWSSMMRKMRSTTRPLQPSQLQMSSFPKMRHTQLLQSSTPAHL